MQYCFHASVYCNSIYLSIYRVHLTNKIVLIMALIIYILKKELQVFWGVGMMMHTE